MSANWERRLSVLVGSASVGEVAASIPQTNPSMKIGTASLTRATGAVYRAAWRQWLYAAEVVVFCSIGARVAGALVRGRNCQRLVRFP